MRFKKSPANASFLRLQQWE